MFKKPNKFKIFDSDALKNFHKRIFFSIIVFSCFYFIAIFRIADVMVFDFNINQLKERIETYDRGKIYDRNGHLLATNIRSFSLYTNPSKLKNKLEIAKKLEKIIDLDKKSIFKKINTDKKFVYLKRNISPFEHQKIIHLGEVNLKTIEEKRRIYPFKNAGSHLVGYVDIDNKGKLGIESAYENILNKNKDLYLTIDINLQNALRNELQKTIDKFSAKSGSVIVMDIENSEILSLINYPDFDPNNYNKSTDDQRLNRVFQLNYEMGSTFKPITVAMGLDDELIRQDMLFDVSKPIKHIRDWEPCDCELSLKEVIVKSSNIGTAQIARIIGKETQKKFFKSFGFFKPININLMKTVNPLGNKHNWGEIETMTIGYGYGFAITPMHLAVAYSALLNDGIKKEPNILLNNQNKDFNKIIKSETSKYIAKLLRAVVEESKYTGPRVKIDGFDIGGKTGTAELTDINGKYDKNSNRTIFISAFPMSNPKYLVLTFIDNPKRKKEYNYSITSATVNAPMVKNIIKRIIEIIKVPKYEKNSILNAATTVNYSNDNVTN